MSWREVADAAMLVQVEYKRQLDATREALAALLAAVDALEAMGAEMAEGRLTGPEVDAYDAARERARAALRAAPAPEAAGAGDDGAARAATEAHEGVDVAVAGLLEQLGGLKHDRRAWRERAERAERERDEWRAGHRAEGEAKDRLNAQLSETSAELARVREAAERVCRVRIGTPKGVKAGLQKDIDALAKALAGGDDAERG